MHLLVAKRDVEINLIITRTPINKMIMKEKKIRCSVCGKLKEEKSFPKNRLLDGTVKVSGDVCYTCVSRKYRNKSKEETEKIKNAANTASLNMLDMIAKLNSMG